MNGRAVFQGSFPHPSQREASGSQRSARPCIPPLPVPHTPAWTHCWQMAAPWGLQIVVSSTAWKSCQVPPASSSTAANVNAGRALGQEQPPGLRRLPQCVPWGWTSIHEDGSSSNACRNSVGNGEAQPCTGAPYLPSVAPGDTVIIAMDAIESGGDLL